MNFDISPPFFALAMVGVILGLLCLHFPIALALMFAGGLGLVVISDVNCILQAFKTIPYSKIASWSLLPLPLFILMGHLASAAGLTTKAYRIAHNWLGWLPGGLAVATTGACAMLGACSGSSVATAGTMGRIALPEMLSYGYDSKLATGAVAAGGLLAIMIPPSTVFVIYGIATETSISRLLLAGVFPGLLTALVFSLCIVAQVKINPKLVCARTSGTTWKSKLVVLSQGWGILILAGVIMGGIYTGVFTASEAAAVGALLAFVFVLVRGPKFLPAIRQAFQDTIAVSSMIFLLIIGASLLSFTIILAGVPRWFMETVVSLGLPTIVILLFIVALYFVMGMFIDTISMMLITLPVVFPVIIGLGYSPIWFGVIMVKFNEMGLITPPVGANAYVIKGVAPPSIPLEDVFRGCIPFVLSELFILSILMAFPVISLWLPLKMKT